MKTKSLVAIIFSILLASCYQQRLVKSMNSYLHHPCGDLVLGEGPADYKADDENGGKIWVYAKQMYYSNAPSVQWWEYRMFYVDKDGDVYHWLLKKEEIPPQQFYVTLKVR
jgi:hypothetical protein